MENSQKLLKRFIKGLHRMYIMKKTGQTKVRLDSTYEISFDELGKKFKIPGIITTITQPNNMSDGPPILKLYVKEYERDIT
jgi:hypothetical protein